MIELPRSRFVDVDKNIFLELETTFVGGKIPYHIVLSTGLKDDEFPTQTVVLIELYTHQEAETMHHDIKDILQATIEDDRGISFDLLKRYGFTV